MAAVNGTLWVSSHVLLWLAVVVLGAAVAVLLRQVGVLRAQLRASGGPLPGHGPLTGTPAPASEAFDFRAADLTLLAFTSAACRRSKALVPSLRAFERAYPDVAVEVVDDTADGASIFRAYAVHSTPYVVAVDRHGVVRGAGVANTLQHIEALIGTVRATG